MVIINAAIALAALSHVVAIESRISHRGRTGLTAIAADRPTCGIGLVLLGSPPEEDSTTESSKSDHSHDDSGRNRGSVLAARGFLLNVVGSGSRARMGCHNNRLPTGLGRNGGRSRVGFRTGFLTSAGCSCAGRLFF